MSRDLWDSEFVNLRLRMWVVSCCGCECPEQWSVSPRLRSINRWLKTCRGRRAKTWKNPWCQHQPKWKCNYWRFRCDCPFWAFREDTGFPLWNTYSKLCFSWGKPCLNQTCPASNSQTTSKTTFWFQQSCATTSLLGQLVIKVFSQFWVCSSFLGFPLLNSTLLDNSKLGHHASNCAWPFVLGGATGRTEHRVTSNANVCSRFWNQNLP